MDAKLGMASKMLTLVFPAGREEHDLAVRQAPSACSVVDGDHGDGVLDELHSEGRRVCRVSSPAVAIAVLRMMPLSQKYCLGE